MIRYVNRRGQVYYLHQGKTKTGKPYYFFAMKTDGILAQEIPDGYEIYEHPNARVYLSRICPKLVTDEEISIVENAVRSYAGLVDFKVDVKKNQIIVFLPDQFFNSYRKRILEEIRVDNAKIEKLFREDLTYSPMMRFVLDDKKRRLFRVDRWCFLGSIYGWIELDGGKLKSLSEEYCAHLGKDSFYELAPW